jgi:Ribonuclease G/E
VISKVYVSRLGDLLVGAAFSPSGLSELLVEPDGGVNDVGDIYLGQVQRVVNGIDGAFIDFGRDRNGFLPIGDDRSMNFESRLQARNSTPQQLRPNLKPGTWLPVQVVRPESGDKGARLTRHLSFPSLYAVFYPDRTGVAVSKKIVDPGERSRLEQLGQTALKRRSLVLKTSNRDASSRDTLNQESSEQEPLGREPMEASIGGLMFRTLSRNVAPELLMADIERVMAQWQMVRSALTLPNVVRCLHQGPSSPLDWIQHWLSQELSEILADDDGVVAQIRDYLALMMPERMGAVKRVDESAKPKFRQQLVHRLDELLDARVELPAGGYLIIEETEAMSTIDVNSGSDVAGPELTATALRTNLEAARQLPRQLKLRNLAGIIAIDFIDMVDPDHQRQVRNRLLDACQNLQMLCRVSEFSEFGVVQISRTQSKLSLRKQMRAIGIAWSAKGSTLYSAHCRAGEIAALVSHTMRSSPSAKIDIRAGAQVLSALFANSDFVSLIEASNGVFNIQAVSDPGICELRVDDHRMGGVSRDESFA